MTDRIEISPETYAQITEAIAGAQSAAKALDMNIPAFLSGLRSAHERLTHCLGKLAEAAGRIEIVKGDGRPDVLLQGEHPGRKLA